MNYNLLAVNFFMAITGLYQLSRKASQDFGGKVCCNKLRMAGMYAFAAERAAAGPLLSWSITCHPLQCAVTGCCAPRLR